MLRLPHNTYNYSDYRFDCKKRKYKYYFPRSNLDLDAMRVACSHLVGSNDYRNLCKMDVGNGVTKFEREILSADIVSVEEDGGDRKFFCFIRCFLRITNIYGLLSFLLILNC
jgi:tRNA pseudouridine(38-40) synthase